MTTMGYFVGFFVGGLTLIAVTSLDLPHWAGILLSAGCLAIGHLVLTAIESLVEEWNE